MLVVDADALQTVDLLDLVNEIGSEFLDTFNRQDIMRRGIAIDDVIALLNDVAVLKVDVLALRDEIFDGLGALLIWNDRYASLIFIIPPELHSARSLGDDRMILWPAGLEQFGNSWKAARNVARLSRFHRNPRDNIAGPYLAAWVNSDDRVHWQDIARFTAARQLRNLAVRRVDRDRWF